MKRLSLVFVLVPAVWSANVPVGDATRGMDLFSSQKCVICHSVNGVGGKTGPDLGRTVSRQYSPASLASTMWNHAPQMWSAMERASVAPPKLDNQQAADLYAYFFAARFFERKGDAGRGRKAFEEKGCGQCHPIQPGVAAPGADVTKWESVSDPIELARQMWNHSPQMKSTMQAKGVRMPRLTAAEMNDITIYLQHLPGTKRHPLRFAPASAATGEELFKLKGCAGCHAGAKALGKGALRTTADFAAAMWNHPQKPPRNSELRPEEMTRLVGYVWSLQFANEGGDPGRGARTFEAKGCAGCHKGAAPKLAHGEADNSFGMVSVLWRHGPAMQQEMRAKGVRWPALSAGDVADVISYLRTRQ